MSTGTGGGQETEIKLRVDSPSQARAVIEAAGFQVDRDRIFEANTIFDTTARQLRERRHLLRIRQAGERITLTFKGPPGAGKHKSREELEIELSDGRTAVLIFERLGYLPTFRYEKYRTEFTTPGEPGTVTLDETPIGTYLELEGTPDWIDRTAARLGFHESDYVTASYLGLYLDHCRQQGVEPAQMVFLEAPRP